MTNQALISQRAEANTRPIGCANAIFNSRPPVESQKEGLKRRLGQRAPEDDSLLLFLENCRSSKPGTESDKSEGEITKETQPRAGIVRCEAAPRSLGAFVPAAVDFNPEPVRWRRRGRERR